MHSEFLVKVEAKQEALRERLSHRETKLIVQNEQPQPSAGNPFPNSF